MLNFVTSAESHEATSAEGRGADPRRRAGSAAIPVDEALFEIVPAGVYVCDTDGRILRWNAKAEELWGCPPAPDSDAEHFCGAPKLFRTDGTPVAPEATPMVDVLRTGEPARDHEFIIEQPSGRRVWVLVNINAVKDSAGRVIGAVNCFQDVTARRQAEAEIRRNEAYLRAIVEATPECIKVVGSDGRLLKMNPAGLSMIEAEDFASVDKADISDIIAPEHRKAWAAFHSSVCAGETRTLEFDIIGRRGTRRHMETHAVPLRLPDGGIAQLAVTRDVTADRKQQAMLREIENRNTQLLEGLPVPLYTTDTDGYVTYYNEACAKLWGERPEPRVARWTGAWRLLHIDGSPMAHDESPMSIALRTGKPVRDVESITVRRDGTRIPVVSFPTPLFDSAGRLAGGANMLVDLTVIKEAEGRRLALIDELNHRVKNTLATVQSLTHLSFRDGCSTEAVRKFEQRLQGLSKTHDLLTLGDWQGIGLRALLQQEATPFIEENRPRIALHGEDVFLRPKMALSLTMAFHELITNAIKHGALGATGGRVSVRWSVEAGQSGRPELAISWTEENGPPARRPERTGFGLRMIERGLAREIKASVALDFAKEGLRGAIRIPLPHGAQGSRESGTA